MGIHKTYIVKEDAYWISMYMVIAVDLYHMLKKGYQRHVKKTEDSGISRL